MKRNKQGYADKALALRLKRSLKAEALWAAREHMIKAKYPLMSMPSSHELLRGLSSDNVRAVKRIWFEVISRGCSA